MSQEKLDLLREALPYIQKFKGKTFVIKFSGKVTEDKDVLASLVEEIALLHQVGIKICVIHGGGKQLSEIAEKLGVAQTIIEGRRVTNDDTLDLAKMIFAGKINTEVLAAFRRRGIDSVGLSGIDGNIVNAQKRPPREVLDRETGNRQMIDFGNVGDIVEINTKLLSLLLNDHYLPIVSSLGADSEGAIFNINADTIAAEIAVRLGAEKLILLSDINGIYLDPNDETTKISQITAIEALQLIETGKATGGMIPKLESLTKILDLGVNAVHIINGNRRNALLTEIFTDEGTGTMLVKSR
ncbi:MAG: acetylglutamate kinase [Acidobacteria bacterium]|nr:acetylglutamate kinase [Acidobacteriota bacterium]